ncbi:hypothetical protein AMIS_2400 [Actinoplanes missouriensis 431]|uniref:Minor tail protein n=1 Tax=Actinoplanes missouriensis (strain ATCC 14538 / DSM 43046 / CBS 188.64 / JCM 3121 / NBRC 102363 / NCIMB 12654 / NRRL B-3342 / UNCC 431) TaxID=512565 RepID=I0GXH3_ACTM4|nr:hypothetical protein [Actinoplanes missouriensis]KOX45260.1 hypothetical protein ADL19_23340 [Streptomyces purpurogeneiscleroticus]BAL85460.1 hypothetical protein AMIS_2400 [Actinoplanes missouriensis 431]
MITLTYDDAVARVRLSATVVGTVAYAVIDRSLTGWRWTTVRGGGRRAPAAGAVALDDYEFPPGKPVTYRVRGYTSGNVLVSTETAVITAVIDRVWLKSVARPFLNRAVTVRTAPAISQPTRSGSFAIKGRSLPVEVAEVRGPREWELEVRTDDPGDTRALELMLALGDVLYLQVPPTYDGDVPTGYVKVGTSSHRRLSQLPGDRRRVWSLPMSERAAPGPDVVGAAATWATLLAEFGTWADVIATFATWADVAAYVADPETVIVP